jgi:hypothetical protein
MAVEQYVLHSKPHKDELLAEQLELRRIETIYPRIRVQVVNPRGLFGNLREKAIYGGQAISL